MTCPPGRVLAKDSRQLRAALSSRLVGCRTVNPENARKVRPVTSETSRKGRSFAREPALLAGRRKVTSFPKPGRHPTGGTVRHAADVARFPCPVRSPPMGDDCGGAHTIRRKGGAHHHIPNCLSRMA